MRRSRFKYWSCSKFADWLRGEKKPDALEWNAWEDWRKEASSKRPVRYFLAETVLDKLQDIVNFPRDLAHSLSAWWHNRFVAKTHCLKTGLPPGRYHELDDRILHGLFNELKEFVESELAHMQSLGGDDKKYVFKRGRCPEAGVDHLLWASALRFGEGEGFKKGDAEWGKPTPQAKSAAKILELYRWWTEVRPNRPNPHDASGWSEHWEKESNDRNKRSAFKKLQKMEEDQEAEDEKMLIRLMKVRKSLWT